jgi:peptidoglycan/LPS O-acetylase OafA/YrhL
MSKVNRIAPLDGLRGIAILMVLLGHGFYSLPSAIQPLVAPFSSGKTGVLIFFVLSGFLIHLVSTKEMERSGGGFSLARFYFRRVLRIFPAFYFYLLVVSALVLLGLVKIPGSLVAIAASFLSNYVVFFPITESTDYFVLGHYWTLALEEQFYLTWPLLIFLLRREWLIPFLLSVMAAMPVLRVLSYYAFPSLRGQLEMMFHTAMDGIAMGVLLGEMNRASKWFASFKKFSSRSSVLLAAGIWILVVSPFLAEKFGNGYSITVGKLVTMIAISILVLGAFNGFFPFLCGLGLRSG